jgi:hypothetical protein
MLAHLSMEEAADRASTLVREDHVRAALIARGIPEPSAAVPLIEAPSENGRHPGFFERLFARLGFAK